METSDLKLARKIINEARACYDPDNPDAHDYYMCVYGLEPGGYLANQIYIFANPEREDLAEERKTLPREDFEALCEQQAAAEKERARELWDRLFPHLERYARACRAAQFRGWSREERGPVRLAGVGELGLPDFPSGARLPEHPSAHPGGDVHVEDLRGGYFGVVLPYQLYNFRSAAYRLGGEWDAEHSYWRFHDSVWLQVRRLLSELYGTDGGMLEPAP